MLFILSNSIYPLHISLSILSYYIIFFSIYLALRPFPAKYPMHRHLHFMFIRTREAQHPQGPRHLAGSRWSDIDRSLAHGGRIRRGREQRYIRNYNSSGAGGGHGLADRLPEASAAQIRLLSCHFSLLLYRNSIHHAAVRLLGVAVRFH